MGASIFGVSVRTVFIVKITLSMKMNINISRYNRGVLYISCAFKHWWRPNPKYRTQFEYHLDKQEVIIKKQFMRKRKKKFLDRWSYDGEGLNTLYVLSTGAQGLGRSVLLQTNKDRYLFNCGEGTQRYIYDVVPNRGTVDNVFFTYNCWNNVGGLIGFFLTNTHNVQRTKPTLLHGPQFVTETLRDIEYFNDTFKQVPAEYEWRGIEHRGYEDDQVIVDYVQLENAKYSDSQNTDSNTNDMTPDKVPSVADNKTAMSYIIQIKENFKNTTCNMPSENQHDYVDDLKLQQDEIGPIVILDCPAHDYLESLLSSEYFIDFETKYKQSPHMIVHMSPSDVVEDECYQQFMAKFTDNTVHLMLNERCSGPVVYKCHQVSSVYHHLHPEIFPCLHGLPTRSARDSTHSARDSTHSDGDSTHLDGDSTHLDGDSTHSDGDSTHSDADSTHLDGDSTHSDADSTHSDGDSTHSNGDSTHSDGDSTHSDGDSAHSDGKPTHSDAGPTHSDGESTHSDGVPTCSDQQTGNTIYGVNKLAYNFNSGPNSGFQWDDVFNIDLDSSLDVEKERARKTALHVVNTSQDNAVKSKWEMFDTTMIDDKLTELKSGISEMNDDTDVADDYPKLTFLGTGSSRPTYHRNGSSILVEIRKDEYILLDCGEGTIIQLYQMYGSRHAEHILCNLKAVFISHLHYDHHGGLFGILEARNRVVSRHGEVKPLMVITHPAIRRWFHVYSRYVLGQEAGIRLYCCNKFFESIKHSLDKADPDMLLVQDELNLTELIPVPVIHTPLSYGLVIKHKDGWKLTYSGDCAPTPALIQYGENSEILIHEATFPDTYRDSAKKKNHCTVSQSISVGEEMKARFTILTHFSTVTKIPVFTDRFTDHVGVAFDFMQVQPCQLKLLPLFKPVLETLYGAGVELSLMKHELFSRRFEERYSNMVKDSAVKEQLVQTALQEEKQQINRSLWLEHSTNLTRKLKISEQFRDKDSSESCDKNNRGKSDIRNEGSSKSCDKNDEGISEICDNLCNNSVDTETSDLRDTVDDETSATIHVHTNSLHHSTNVRIKKDKKFNINNSLLEKLKKKKG